MLFTPEEHPKNPPASWLVVKKAKGLWHLTTAAGDVLEYGLKTRQKGEELKTQGHLVRLYEQEGRWFAGEHIPGWKDYTAPQA